MSSSSMDEPAKLGSFNEHHLSSGNVSEDAVGAARRDNILSTITIIFIQAIVAGCCSQMTYATVEGGNKHWAYSYGAFRDVNIMIFFGFGFLMTFLHRHGLSAVGYCLVISALVVEMSIPIEYALFKGSEVPTIDGAYPVSIENMMNGLFCAGAVMISYGAVIGKVTPYQLIVMCVVEVFAFWLNMRFVFKDVQAHDVGGGMVIHTFGAYFGLAATFWVTRASPASKDNVEEKSIYSSDIFSLAGTIFLWVLWPSFQSAVAGTEQRQFLAVTNTFISLASSTLAFALFSRWLNNNKFDVVHMQNATLAGGVVMGVAGDMDMGMGGAMAAGFAAGMVSCLGYTFLMPRLAHCNIHDTCGVNNLHGMPGILGALVGFFVTYDLGNGEDNGTRDIRGFTKDTGDGVGAKEQIYGLLISIGMALFFGTVAGILMTLPLKQLGIYAPGKELYNDRLFFGEADDYADIVTTSASGDIPDAPVPAPVPVVPAPTDEI